jgi:hypothetical protein
MPLSSTYTSATPQSNQQVNTTQSSINYNFEDISTLFAVNHVPFNTADTFGRHNFINFITQATDPATASAEMALYTKSVSGDTNDAELFYRYPNSGSVLQLTGNSSSGSTGSGGGLFSSLFSSSQEGQVGYPGVGSWQYLSNGILIMTWNVANGYPGTTGNGSTSPMIIYFPSPTYSYTTKGSTTMPSFTTAVYNLQMASTNPVANADEYPDNQTNNGITIVNTTTANLYWTGTATQGAQGSIVVTAIGI